MGMKSKRIIIFSEVYKKSSKKVIEMTSSYVNTKFFKDIKLTFKQKKLIKYKGIYFFKIFEEKLKFFDLLHRKMKIIKEINIKTKNLKDRKDYIIKLSYFLDNILLKRKFL